jgi:hypothetical protein
MKIKTIEDLPDGEEIFIGPSHGQFCNRYLRRGNLVEVENIHRHGKKQPTYHMSAKDFNEWRNQIEKQRGA